MLRVEEGREGPEMTEGEEEREKRGQERGEEIEHSQADLAVVPRWQKPHFLYHARESTGGVGTSRESENEDVVPVAVKVHQVFVGVAQELGVIPEEESAFPAALSSPDQSVDLCNGPIPLRLHSPPSLAPPSL